MSFHHWFLVNKGKRQWGSTEGRRATHFGRTKVEDLVILGEVVVVQSADFHLTREEVSSDESKESKRQPKC